MVRIPLSTPILDVGIIRTRTPIHVRRASLEVAVHDMDLARSVLLRILIPVLLHIM